MQNVGFHELRLRVRVLGLVAASPMDGGLGQAARILERPRGVLAPGLRARVSVEFSAEATGSLTALIVIEGNDQSKVEVPVDGVASDGHEHFDAVHSRVTTASGLAPSSQPAAPSPAFTITQTVGPQGEGGWFGE